MLNFAPWKPFTETLPTKKRNEIMYDQVRDDVLYIMLYAVAAALAIVAAAYLLLRRGNAFATDVTPPPRLRRWAAAFFASLALNHVWYIPIFFLDSSHDIKTVDLLGGMLDSMTFLPLAIDVMLVMLQDRRRPLWPAFAAMAPLSAGSAWCAAKGSYAPLPFFHAYALMLAAAIIIYIVRALRQYGRWLRDNYADLKHKELSQSFAVLGFTLTAFSIYALVANGPVYQYAMQLICIIFIGYLLWRVETLSDLSAQEVSGDEVAPLSGYEVAPLPGYEVAPLSGYEVAPLPGYEVAPLPGDEVAPLPGDEVAPLSGYEVTSPDNLKTSKPHNLKTSQPKVLTLLQQHCIDTQLYLQHDLTVSQLAKAIGTNRLYLSQYFSAQGITYNAYINDLRIRHFINLYREAVDKQRPFTAQQLAYESGYRSYSTFGIAFKQRTGQTVTAWMRDTDK